MFQYGSVLVKIGNRVPTPLVTNASVRKEVTGH
jgi:hypothetical protein